MRRRWVEGFRPLERLGVPIGPGAVLSLNRERMPLERKVDALPLTLV